MLNRAIKSLPKLYRKDTLINTLYDSGYLVYNKEDELNTANYNNIFFSKLNEYGCSNYEYDLDIKPLANLTDRRNAIESKWKAWAKCSLQSLQALASRYFNNDVKVSYNGDAEVTYTARLGFKNRYTDETYQQWLSDNNIVFPAHMVMNWIYEKNRWRDYFTDLNWGKAKNNYLWNTISMSWGEAKVHDQHGKTWEYMNTRSWNATLNEEIEY